MPAVATLNSTSSHGGNMITASGDTFGNNSGICIDGDMHQCPISGHGITPVSAISTKDVYVNGKKIVVIGDKAACGAVITSGSPSINIS